MYSTSEYFFSRKRKLSSTLLYDIRMSDIDSDCSSKNENSVFVNAFKINNCDSSALLINSNSIAKKLIMKWLSII